MPQSNEACVSQLLSLCYRAHVPQLLKPTHLEPACDFYLPMWLITLHEASIFQTLLEMVDHLSPLSFILEDNILKHSLLFI